MEGKQKATIPTVFPPQKKKNRKILNEVIFN